MLSKVSSENGRLRGNVRLLRLVLPVAFDNSSSFRDTSDKERGLLYHSKKDTWLRKGLAERNRRRKRRSIEIVMVNTKASMTVDGSVVSFHWFRSIPRARARAGNCKPRKSKCFPS